MRLYLASRVSTLPMYQPCMAPLHVATLTVTDLSSNQFTITISMQMCEYTELLTHFLNPRVRALPEDASKRAEALIRFLRNLKYVREVKIQTESWEVWKTQRLVDINPRGKFVQGFLAK